MKPKISPEAYREILSALELDTLYLNEINSKFREDCVGKKLLLNIDETNTFNQESNTLKVIYSYKLTAKDASLEEAAITIHAKYVVKYRVMKEVLISKDFMRVFSDLTINMLLWTYFRELVSNLVYRIGMPPLTLPLKKR